MFHFFSPLANRSEVAQGLHGDCSMGKLFTDKLISNLKPKEKKYYMREGRGFAIQVLPSGCKTFIYIYTFGGKRKHFNLGTYPATSLADARQKYMDAALLVGRGKDPQADSKLSDT